VPLLHEDWTLKIIYQLKLCEANYGLHVHFTNKENHAAPQHSYDCHEKTVTAILNVLTADPNPAYSVSER
jgi:hypothetical protein